jgi:hypothetical protein
VNTAKKLVACGRLEGKGRFHLPPGPLSEGQSTPALYALLFLRLHSFSTGKGRH